MDTINYSNKTLNRNEAESLFVQIEKSKTSQYRGDDDQLRDFLSPVINSYDQLFRDNNETGRKKYYIDIKIGLILYELLPPINLGIRIASNDDFWRYLSLKVLPDLVFERWGFVSDRYWRKPNRIWLKIIWWFIHLSWQGNLEVTNKSLLSPALSTDTIAQLIERTGRHGYRIDLYRCIMRKTIENRLDQNEFRALMVLNIIKTVTIEPSFVEGNVCGFVDQLISIIRKG